MILRVFVSLLVVISFLMANAHALMTTAKITIKVVDESSEPIEGARVGIGFEENTGWGTSQTGVVGVSTNDGRFSASKSSNGHIGFNVTKDGYYASFGNYDYEKLEAFGWKPNNPELTVVLREIGNQIPMYARDTNESRIEIPETNKDIGFDLIKFDWVAPYGSGIKSDFIFHLTTYFPSSKEYSYDLRLKFPNESDGVIPIDEDLETGSVFKLPREAPLMGYQKSKKIFAKKIKGSIKRSREKNRSYVFRIRSSQDEDGNVKAMYGKILGDFNIGTKKQGTAYIKFKYYLNPDGTRNLEYDPNRNLFGKLPLLERVGIN